MSRTVMGVFAVLLALWAAVSAGADTAIPETAAADVQDILFCAPRRPYLIRLHLTVHGKGFRAARQAWADARFKEYDADANGFLEGEELRRLPAPEVLLSGVTMDSLRRLEADSEPKDGKVSPEECRRYLLAATGTPFRLVNQTNNGAVFNADGAAAAQVNLFPKLDADRDGKLSEAEIKNVASRLRRYDRNEDDMVDAVELQQGLPEEQSVALQRLSGVMGLLIVVDSIDQGHALSRKLLEAYDKVSRDPVAKTFRKDERLSATELPIDKEAFTRADKNRDGKLDRTELAKLSSVLSATVELSVEAPSATGEFRIRSLNSSNPQESGLIGVTQASGDSPLLTLSETALALTAADSNSGIEQQLRDTYLQQFKSLDQDKNDYLERPELQRFGFQDSFFAQADVDGDGKLFEEEYKAHIEREIELSKTSFTLEITGDGRSLFRLIDTLPADARLSLRELSEASARLLRGDSNQDGMITPAELSIALNAVFRAGTPRIEGPFGISRQIVAASNTTASAGNEAQTPIWFTKMDRNGDGDLSPKEFLGRKALFDQIDGNQDGLISSAEALAAHRQAVDKTPP